MPETLTLKQAARSLRISESQAYKMCERGELPAKKKGKRWRVRKMFNERVVTPRGLAEAMGMSERYVTKLCKQGVLEGRKIGVLWRIPMSEAAKWMVCRMGGD